MILTVCPNPSIDCYAWLENFKPGQVNRIKKIKEYPGGKGVHVALAIAELGGKSELIGNWAGRAGDWIKNTCFQKGLTVTGAKLSGNNRKCYTFRSSYKDFNNTEVLEPGPEMSTENWNEFIVLFKNQIFKANLVCLSGSWPQNAPKDAYRQLIKIAEQQNIKVFLDCSGSQLEEALKSPFFALHLNEDEAFKLCGSTNFDDLLKKLDNRVELVALTKGKKGLHLWYKGKSVMANVDIDKVISTVGSGDCLTAGIAWAFEQAYGIEEMAAYGVACGAANCLNEELGMLKKGDVELLLPKVYFKTTKNEF